jgi:hypothetical protein
MKYCIIFTTGNTTNLMAHLNQAHLEEMPGVVPKKKKTQCQTKLTQPTTSSQSFISASTCTMNNDRRKTLNDALIKLLAGKILPLSLVDNELFKNFIKLLDPRFV